MEISLLEEIISEAILLIEQVSTWLRMWGRLLNKSGSEETIRAQGNIVDLLVLLGCKITDLTTKIKLLFCFQLNSGLCVICQKFSEYQWQMIKVVLTTKNVFIRLRREYLVYFPRHQFTSNVILNELQKRVNRKVLWQFQLDAARPIEKCGCVQLPREELDRLTRKAIELKRQYSS